MATHMASVGQKIQASIDAYRELKKRQRQQYTEQNALLIAKQLGILDANAEKIDQEIQSAISRGKQTLFLEKLPIFAYPEIQNIAFETLRNWVENRYDSVVQCSGFTANSPGEFCLVWNV